MIHAAAVVSLFGALGDASIPDTSSVCSFFPMCVAIDTTEAPQLSTHAAPPSTLDGTAGEMDRCEMNGILLRRVRVMMQHCGVGSKRC